VKHEEVAAGHTLPLGGNVGLRAPPFVNTAEWARPTAPRQWENFQESRWVGLEKLFLGADRECLPHQAPHRLCPVWEIILLGAPRIYGVKIGLLPTAADQFSFAGCAQRTRLFSFS
jgi:hypothetical protein